MEPIRLPSIHDLGLSQPGFAAAPPRDKRLAKIVANCRVLCEFVEHHEIALQEANKPEIIGMVERAVEIVTILKSYQHTASCLSLAPADPVFTPARPLSRPREDAIEEQPNVHVNSLQSGQPSQFLLSSESSPVQVTRTNTFDGIFESDLSVKKQNSGKIMMCDAEDIGTKRAISRGGLRGKVKYKKRSRASPPGQCNSCDIVDTPEWRRGPDGQRTLCNACGLHYAKLMHRRDVIISALPDGDQIPPPINIEFLRNSARAAAERSTIARSVRRRRTPKEESKKGSEPPRMKLAARFGSELGGNGSHAQNGTQQQFGTGHDTMLPRYRSASSSGQTNTACLLDDVMPYASRGYPARSTDGWLIHPTVLPLPAPLMRGRGPISIFPPYPQPHIGPYHSVYNQHPPLSNEPFLPGYAATSQQGMIVPRPPE